MAKASRLDQIVYEETTAMRHLDDHDAHRIVVIIGLWHRKWLGLIYQDEFTRLHSQVQLQFLMMRHNRL
ncbi:MAG: hypothetical protein CMK72_04615 [Pseudomonadaceae bacterium]|nr:hypothetical protein [Pseudomonadaceae bacterium]HCP53927.1 hypothetical protein [Pseudomonas sp.]